MRQPFKTIERALARQQVLTTTKGISARMATVRQTGTGPELSVRSAARAIGLRYTLRNRDLPGCPDLANRKRKLAIFVHGCYWHRHSGCSRSTTPKSNVPFWSAKFEKNVDRDRAAVRDLEQLGFSAVVIWECEAQNHPEICRRLRDAVIPKVGEERIEKGA